MTIAPEPNDQFVTPDIGGEELEAWLASVNDGQQIDLPALSATPAGQFVKSQQEGDDDVPDPEADDETPDDDETGEPTPTTQEGVDYFTVNGKQFAREDIERLYNFDQFMRQNPDTAQRVAQALQPTSTPAVPATETTPASAVEEWTEPTPPDDLDLDDPIAKFTWNSMVSMQKSQFQIAKQQEQFLQAQAQDRQNQLNQQAHADMTSALTKFRTEYPGLNDDDIATIRTEAAPLLPAYMAQLPPVEAMRRSMEVAAYANTDLRPRLESDDPKPTAHQRSTRRKQKLSSVSGTPRSAPKVDAKPSFSNDRDMVRGFAEALSDSMTGR